MTAGIIAVGLVAVWFLVSLVSAIPLAIFALWDFSRFRKASVMYQPMTLDVMFTEEEKQTIKDNKLNSPASDDGSIDRPRRKRESGA